MRHCGVSPPLDFQLFNFSGSLQSRTNTDIRLHVATYLRTFYGQLYSLRRPGGHKDNRKNILNQRDMPPSDMESLAMDRTTGRSISRCEDRRLDSEKEKRAQRKDGLPVNSDFRYVRPDVPVKDRTLRPYQRIHRVECRRRLSPEQLLFLFRAPRTKSWRHNCVAILYIGC